MSNSGYTEIEIDSLLRLSENWLSSSWVEEKFDYQDLSKEDLDFLINQLNSDPNNSFTYDNIGDYFYSLGGMWSGIDPRLMDLNYDGIVNYKDFYILTLLWGTPDIQVEIIDPQTNRVLQFDNLYGSISILMDYSTVWWANEVLVYVNENLVGNWDFSTQLYPEVKLCTQHFPNGINDLTLVRRSGDFYLPTTYKVTFNNMLSNIKADDFIKLSDPNDPNSVSPYSFSGYATDPIYAEIIDFNGDPVWAKEISVGEFHFNVDGNNFLEPFLGELILRSDPNFNDPNLYGQSFIGVLSEDISKKEFKKYIKSGFTKEKANKAEMAIILPSSSVTKARRKPISEAIKTANKRHVPFVILSGYEVNWENISYVYNLKGIKYIYWVGHGNREVYDSETEGSVQRTNFSIWKKEWSLSRPLSLWSRDSLFSYTKKTNPDADPLPDDWDEEGKSLAGLNMYEQRNKKIIIKDTCLSAYHDDAAFYYGVYSTSGYGSLDQIYIGWRTSVTTAGLRHMDIMVGDTNNGWTIFWEELGKGRSVYSALYAIYDRGSGPSCKAFFGDDTIPQIGDKSSDDNIMVYGTSVNQIFGYQ